MTIKIERADGEIEIFNSDNYRIGKSKDFHPLICTVSVYDNGVKIKTMKRPFKFFYKHFTFKSKKVQEQLKKLEEQETPEKVEEQAKPETND